MTRERRSDQLIHSLLREVADGLHVANHRFLSRRQIEQQWNVSNKTAASALSFLISYGILKRSHKVAILTPGGARTARIVARRQQARPLPRVQSNKDTTATTSQPEFLRSSGRFLYEQLVTALLTEIASGAYPAGQRFLSRRRICSRWAVSAPTAERARAFLLRQGLLAQSNSRLTVVARGALEQACLLLDRFAVPALEATRSWIASRNRLLHCDVPCHRLAVVHTESDPAHAPYLEAFRQEVESHGCTAELLHYDESAADTAMILRHVRSAGINGIAIIDPRIALTATDLLAELRKTGASVITVFNNFEGRAEASIECNETACGYAAMKILLDRGHRDIAVICPAPDCSFVSRRDTGARLYLAQMRYTKGVTCRHFTVQSQRRIVSTVSAALSGHDWRPSALLILDSRMLAATGRTLQRIGIKVPDDLSVIGCGSRDDSWCLKPQVDIIERDHQGLGIIAARQLIRLLNGEHIPRAVQLATPYLKRGTVATVGNQLLHDKGILVYKPLPPD